MKLGCFYQILGVNVKFEGIYEVHQKFFKCSPKLLQNLVVDK